MYFDALQSAVNNALFLDSSPNNLTITRNGTSVIQESGGVFTNSGRGSFPGSTSNYLSLSSSGFNRAGGDFTLECAVRFNVVNVDQPIFSTTLNAEYDDRDYSLILASNGVIQPSDGYGNFSGNYPGTARSANTWYHVAMVRWQGYLQFYVSGTLIDTRVYQLNLTKTNIWIGAGYVQNGEDLQYYNRALNGKLGYLRFSNAARYTSSTYSVPTAHFSSDANTVLLMKFDNY